MKIPTHLLVSLVWMLGSSLFAQQHRVHLQKQAPLPSNMDCQKLQGDKEMSTNRSSTILKRGADYYVCQPKSQTLLAKARTAAVTVHSTQTITCGDGSTSDCIREDTRTHRQLEQIANNTNLWT